MCAQLVNQAVKYFLNPFPNGIRWRSIHGMVQQRNHNIIQSNPPTPFMVDVGHKIDVFNRV
jgi:hypothetical protein